MKQQVFAKSIGILKRQFQMYISVALKESDISFSEYIFLVNLYENEGINQEELSACLCIDKAATARAIKSLEKKGILIRKKNSMDKRVRELYLTEKGTNLNNYYCSLIEKWANFITQGMDHEVEDIVMNGIKYFGERAKNADFEEIVETKEKLEHETNKEEKNENGYKYKV